MKNLKSSTQRVSFKKITECQIFLTRRCNLRCGYCKLTQNPLKKELNIDQWKKSFKNLEKIGIKTVKILGGEPTIVDGFENLLKFIDKETSIKYAVLSNSIFNDKKLNSLVDAKIQGYFASIDGIENIKTVDKYGVAKSHAGFDKLKKFKAKGVELLGANVVITKKNLSDIPEIIKVLSENGIWVNLCPIVYGKEDFWELRADVSDEFKFSDVDILKINNIMIKLLQMKLEGAKIVAPKSYLINMSKYGIYNNWKCKELALLRIDADGALMLCNDIKGKVAEKYNILDMDKDKFEKFKKDWKKERIKIDCPGCYWSCFLLAEDNLRNNRLEFDYIKQK